MFFLLLLLSSVLFVYLSFLVQLSLYWVAKRVKYSGQLSSAISAASARSHQVPIPRGGHASIHSFFSHQLTICLPDYFSALFSISFLTSTLIQFFIYWYFLLAFVLSVFFKNSKKSDKSNNWIKYILNHKEKIFFIRFFKSYLVILNSLSIYLYLL